MKRIVFIALASAGLAAAVGRPIQAKAPWVKKAQAAGFTEIKDCKSCHTKSSGRELNARGAFLADRKNELDVEDVDLQWLKDYKEAAATEPETKPEPTARIEPEAKKE